MRGAPPLSLQGASDPWWRGFCGAMSLIAVLAISIWCGLWWAQDTPLQRQSRGLALCAAAALSAIALVGAGRPARWLLHWDGQRWWLSTGRGPAASAVAGDIVPMLDVGPWMLLRFCPSPCGTRWRPVATTWLSVHRSRHAGQWHGLRCAVYSPRSARLDSPASARGAPPSSP